MANARGLQAAHDPSCVAVIGASDDPDKIGGRPIFFMRRHGFAGHIVPVNPRRDTVQGLPAVATVAEADPVPDAAVIAVPGQAAVDAVADCAAVGVQVAVVVSSGFGEGDDPAGLEQLQQMRAYAQAAGMRLVGPNSQGLANFASGAILTFSTLVREIEPADGPVAVVSQSGAMASVPYALLRERGLGVRYAHATGNDADVSVGELAALCAADPDIRLLILYLENLSRPGELAAAAAEARRRSVPILAVVGGRSDVGQAAAGSHTGALASERRVVEAFLAKLGIWSATSMAEVVDMAPLYLQGWRPRGRRLGVISSSGAICVLAADAAEDVGLPLATLDPATTTRLQQTLPRFAATTNPVDLTAALLTDGSLIGAALDAVAADDNVDALFLGIPVAGQGYDVERFAKDAGALAASGTRPFVTAFPTAKIRQAFADQGVVTFDDEARALRALAAYLSHLDLARRAAPHRWAAPPTSAGSEYPPVTADEVSSLRLLADSGLHPVRHEHVADPQQAADAFARLGAARVVAKGVSAAVTHKSDIGLVELGLSDPAQVAAAVDRITANARDHDVRLDGVLLAEQVDGLAEMLVGAHVDPVFGPVVMVGAGGRYVEALPDVALVLPPADDAEVRAALDGLRIRPLLDGVRGDPPADLDALVDAVHAVGSLVTDSGSDVVSVDVNPLMLLRDGAVAADAVVLRGLAR